MKKTLQDLTIKDPFMFAAAMSDAEQSRRFLSIVLDIEILEVTVVTEKTIVYHPEYHGIRLDVLAIEKGSRRHFDVEMQVKDKKNLPKRSRYYHSQMDMDLLLKGDNYNELPDTYVIFICEYDPLGNDMYKYTRSLKKQITAIKQNRDWEARFMLLEEMLEDEREEGREEGMSLGRLSGLSDAVLELLSISEDVSEKLKQQIENQKDERILKQWLVLAKSANSVQDFVQKAELGS